MVKNKTVRSLSTTEPLHLVILNITENHSISRKKSALAIGGGSRNGSLFDITLGIQNRLIVDAPLNRGADLFGVFEIADGDLLARRQLKHDRSRIQHSARQSPFDDSVSYDPIRNLVLSGARKAGIDVQPVRLKPNMRGEKPQHRMRHEKRHTDRENQQAQPGDPGSCVSVSPEPGEKYSIADRYDNDGDEKRLFGGRIRFSRRDRQIVIFAKHQLIRRNLPTERIHP